MVNEKSNRAGSGRAATKHAALGRGLGALIPSQVTNDDGSVAASGSAVDPLDVLFPGRPSGARARARGGSAKDLLIPKSSSTSKARKSAKSSSAARSDAKSANANDRGMDGKDASSVSSSLDEQATHGRRNGSPAHSSSTTPSGRKLESSSESGTTAAALADSHKPSARLSSPSNELAENNREHSSPDVDVSRETSQDLLPVPGATFADIPIDYIVPNARQPREVFDEDDLAELRDSIREVGVLQPIVVRPIDFDAEHSPRLVEYMDEKPNARFELIMGERRLRASELAGFDSVPAIIRQTEDEDLLRDALLENLHRAQLNPLEEASAYQQLMADFGATQEQLAKRIARSRPQIANTLRLLKLPPAVQKKVAAQVISAGHARALLSLGTAQEMEMLAERIVAEGLSVRTTEELVRLGRVKSVSRTRTPRVPVVSPLGESVVSALENLYETRVTITEGAKKGKIIIEFAGQEDLERIKDLIARQG